MSKWDVFDSVPMFEPKDLDGLPVTLRYVEEDGCWMLMAFDEIGSCYALQEGKRSE